jgi:2Fe-2S ferredoxin
MRRGEVSHCRIPSVRLESMAKITYVLPDRAERVVEVKNGLSLMEGAVRSSVPGIDADCGGACACATCHIYVEPEWLPMMAPPTQMEESMLEFAEDVQVNSRLSCQIKISSQLDGLIVRIPRAR